MIQHPDINLFFDYYYLKPAGISFIFVFPIHYLLKHFMLISPISSFNQVRLFIRLIRSDF